MRIKFYEACYRFVVDNFTQPVPFADAIRFGSRHPLAVRIAGLVLSAAPRLAWEAVHHL